MGLLPLTYRRPSYVEKASLPDNDTSSGNGDEKGEPIRKTSTSSTSTKSGRSGTSNGIPPALGFDKILSGGTCPPCTIRDFMNYLLYIERSAENLQFLLWLRDYNKRFIEADTSDKALAFEWTHGMAEETLGRINRDHAERARRAAKKGPAADIFKGTDFEKGVGVVRNTSVPDTNPFSTPPGTPQDGDPETSYNGSNAVSYRNQANDAIAAAGGKAPFTIQPFREEIDRVVTTYIMDGAPRQLNLSDREQKATLQALAYTTHPTAFRLVANTVETTLRGQSHLNFVRWSVCNGNPARVFFARALGVGLTATSTAVAVVLTLSHAPRGYRALAAIGWVLGIATLIAAHKGMCVVLHGLHHRHVRPWELFVNEEDPEDGVSKRSFDTFGTSNSYEDEPWVMRYQKRNIIRKIFDREIWIQEPALRQIQDTIFVQSMLCALLLACLLTALFVAVPGGHFF